MFHMLSCFNLQTGASLDEFRHALAEFTQHLQAIDLVQSTGPVGRRQSNTIMDTDSERDHEYFFYHVISRSRSMRPRREPHFAS